MLLNEIMNSLKQVYDRYSNVRIGVAGSYANNTQHADSDIDIVIDGDSTRIDIAEFIRGLFNKTVDILWLDLMKADDEEMDTFAIKNDLPVNEYSAYKTVMQEVMWVV